MILRHARVRRIRSGSHIGKHVGWHLKNFRYSRNGVHSGRGFALRSIRTRHFTRTHLDKSTEYNNGVVIHHK